MKRTNLVLDEELLEEAMRETGERTYSGAVNKALSELVRVARLKRAIDDLKAAGPGGYFPNYLKTIRPNAYSPNARRRSANEVRAPRKAKAAKRGSR